MATQADSPIHQARRPRSVSAPRLAPFLIALAGLTACAVPYTGGARVVSPSEIGDGWYRAAATPVVRQRKQTDCGLAALAMVEGAWGRNYSVAQLDDQLPPTDHGLKLGALRDLARSHGLDAYAIKATPEDLAHELSAGRPVMLGLILPFDRERNTSHYEVAVAMNPRDGTVVTIDPASGDWRKRSKQVLELEWKPAGYAALVVTGNRQAAAR